MKSLESLAWLQAWYKTQSNGVWEHSYGIKIDTIDNPGWNIVIDLKGTPLQGVYFEIELIERSKNDWVSYKITDDQFIGYGGPENLGELIDLFKEIYEKQ
jgi:hypothetical protein